MILKILSTVFVLVALSSFPSHSALISNINDLEIDGIKYNVTFNGAATFDDLFDFDADGVFDDADGSLFDRGPTFLENQFSASIAAQAIIDFLGEEHYTSTENQFDGFLVPFKYIRDTDSRFNTVIGTTDLLRNNARVADIPGEIVWQPSDIVKDYPIVTFEVASQVVPSPPTYALLGLALAVMGGLGVFGRRRRVC